MDPNRYFDLLGRTSRSFSWVISALEEPLRTELCLGYLLCRILDTYEDAVTVPAPLRHALLERSATMIRSLASPDAAALIESGLEDRAELHKLDTQWPTDPGPLAGYSRDERELLVESPSVWRAIAALPHSRRKVMSRTLIDMAEGMAREVARRQEKGDLSPRTAEETESYCHTVASTVGLMITGLISELGAPVSGAEVEREAVSFGKTLQLVNILKDFRSDWDSGRCFWPGLRLPEGPGQPLPSPAELEAPLRTLLEAFDRHSELADSYTARVRGFRQDVHFICALPLGMAKLTVDILRGAPDGAKRVLEVDPIKIRREEALALAARLQAGA